MEKDDNGKSGDKSFAELSLIYGHKLANQAQSDEIDNYNFIDVKNIKSTCQPWLWPGFIPLQTICLFAGEGGIGKSQLLLEIASKVSSGEKFLACGEEIQLPKGKVLILSAEDDEESQLKPKLIASEANLDNISLVKETIGVLSKTRKFIDLHKKLFMMENALNLLNKEGDPVKLIVIDPIVYFIGELKDNYNSCVAQFLQSLIRLAKKYDLAIILNKHFRKKSSGTSVTTAIDEVGGAGAWINSPRIAWSITRHHDQQDLIVISKLKVNITHIGTDCLSYKLEQTVIEDGGIKIPTLKLVWNDRYVSMSANDAANKDAYESNRLKRAYDFIINYLTENGQSIAKNVIEEAVKAGIALRTCERAIVKLKEDKRLKIEPGIRKNKLWTLKTIEDEL